MIQSIALPGCRSAPLGHYLKALAVLRLIAEQRDPSTRGFWEGNRFHVETQLSRDDLEQFFFSEYRPTPIIAPWNGGSGFYPSDRQSGIDPIRQAAHERYGAYRESLRVADHVLKNLGDERDKRTLVTHLRALLPDVTLPWLDAVLLLTSDGLRFPPLLGTGGNDGRLEFTNNFMQQLVTMIDPRDGSVAPRNREWLRASLFAEPAPLLPRPPVGQFLPASFGGANASTGFHGGQPANPWDYILMIEGAIMFSAAATRAGSADQTDLSYPFTVRASGSGSGGLSFDEPSSARGEMWLPIWTRPAPYAELKELFSEGRLTVGRRIARDGFEVVLAIARLGVDRGIAAFERVVFSQRNGLMYIATPQGRWTVDPRRRVDLIADLYRDEWLPRVRRFARSAEAPIAVKAAVRRLEESITEACRRADVGPMQNVLSAVAELHLIGHRSRAFQEGLQPLRRMSTAWIDAICDDTVELEIARALCSIGRGETSLRFELLPFRRTRGEKHEWAGSGPGGVEVLELDRLLARILLSRSTAIERGADLVCLMGRYGISIATWSRFLRGDFDQRRVRELLFGIALVRATGGAEKKSGDDLVLEAFPALLKTLFLDPDSESDRGARETKRLELPGIRKMRRDAAQALASGQLELAGDVAVAALSRDRRRVMRFQHVPCAVSPDPTLVTPALAGRRIAAALLLPISSSATNDLVSIVFERGRSD